ncbi:hypothetical protein V7161_29435 [Neobacillus drentensis]|uniref:hypothetical protein n=1 Tax=Neobacillus drentensis TaxID=220684 RepID=UPI0030023181
MDGLWVIITIILIGIFDWIVSWRIQNEKKKVRFKTVLWGIAFIIFLVLMLIQYL